MSRLKRYLVLSDLADSWTEEFAERQRAAFAACPEAHGYSDEEAEDFLATATALDVVDRSDRYDLGKPLRKAGIAYPPELAYDAYRLGRHLLHRWGDAAFRETLMHRVLQPDAQAFARLRRDVNRALAVVSQNRLASGLAALRWSGLADMIPAVKAAFTPKQQTQYAAQLLYGKLRLHEFLTTPEPARAPSRWEQQKMLRRLHLRQVQMRSLGRSLHHLRRERKALLNHLRSLSGEVPELRPLAEQLEAVRAEQAAVESRHAEALAAQTQLHEAAVLALQAEIHAARAGYAEALAMRDRLLGAPRRSPQ